MYFLTPPHPHTQGPFYWEGCLGVCMGWVGRLGHRFCVLWMLYVDLDLAPEQFFSYFWIL